MHPSLIELQQSFLGHDSICFFSIFILSWQSFLYRNRSFFGSLTICPVRSIVLSILCRDNLMCVYWNSYVATLTIVLQHCLCVASSNLCHDPVFMSQQDFLYLAHLCVATQFVMSRQGLSSLCWNLCRDIEKSVATLFICV